MTNPKDRLDKQGSYRGKPLEKMTKAELTKALVESNKAYGGCSKCFGKGYSTEMSATVASSDFPDWLPIRRKKINQGIKMNYCTCSRGKQLELLNEGR